MTVLDSVLDLFTQVGTWFSEFVPSMFTMFWVPGADGSGGELTFLGVLAVAGLAISIIFLRQTGQRSSDITTESSLIAGNSLHFARC